ncbi:TonB-dependent receptor [Novosphingobium sp. G106]|nr:TonB-dependent receptor [Novosphingobium sp. G106]MBV1687949.1 TonB-dependent receptor [Novosphingobium sp. G106]
MSISVVPLTQGTSDGLAMGSREVTYEVDGLTLTNLGPGRNRQFIRGVADSAFNGPSQSTVAVQLDEARITFDAPDPDLRLVDMERIEVLKGPQGPLYGSGALGGIYHMVTRKPDLSAPAGEIRAIGEAVDHGDLGWGGEVTFNLPVVTDRLGLRGVAYSVRAGGWIDNIGRNRNANGTATDGLRLALRWQPAPEWTLDVAGALQDINSKDSQYVMAPEETARTNVRIPEPTDNDFKSLSATLQGPVGALKLLATSSYVNHEVSYTLDSTDSSADFGLSGASRFDSDSKYTIINHELRLTPAASSLWLIGVSYLHAHSHTIGTIETATDRLTVEALDRYTTEFSVFGEGTIPLFDRLSATAGARLFRSIAEDETSEQHGLSSDRVTKTILSPSLSLAWTPNRQTLVYLRYARALRPGGLAPADQPGARRFEADHLSTIDLGLRYAAADRFTANASLFYTDWYHIQSDYLLANGLISTRNAGHGRILGIEGSLEWKPAKGLQVTFGATYTDALLLSTENKIAIDDRRLPVVPDLTARLAVRYGFGVGPWKADIGMQANYVGKARLTFDPDLDRQMGNYLPVSASATIARDRLRLSVRLDNLFDIQGDTFAFGNQFSIMNSQQYTPLRPRTLTLSIARSW